MGRIYRAAHHDIVDPLVASFLTINQQYTVPEERIRAFLAIETIFGHDLSKNADFIQTITTACKLLNSMGALAAVASLHA